MVQEEFLSLVRDIVRTREFQALRGRRHHLRSSVYYHSLKVAYLCYCHQRHRSSPAELRALVRSALLHDYVLWNGLHGLKRRWNHVFTHPREALQSALCRYPGLSVAEQDAIRHHMFPLTVIPPKTKTGWLICYYDKLAAISDYFGKRRWKGAAEGQGI